MTLEIKKPWARGSTTTPKFGGFLVVENHSESPDRLLSATSDAARRIFICGIKVVGSGITMRALAKGLAIPSNTTITLKPRGYHLLMLGLKDPQMKVGSKVPVRLTFEKAGTFDVAFPVEASGPVGKETLVEAP